MHPHRWDDLKTFLATWRAGSLLGAGKALGVNASTIGRRLHALEEAVGVQLFERTKEGVLPTVHAERLLAWVEAVEQAHQGFVNAVGGLEREPVGTVRVTGPPGLVDHFLAPAMGALRHRHPGLQVVLDASVGYADLSRGEADIALRASRPTRGDLVTRRIGPFGSAVIGASSVYAGGPPVAELGALPWLQWGADLAHIPDALWIAEHVPAEAIVLRTSSISAQLEAARAGVGVMLGAAAYATLDGVCELSLTGEAEALVAARPGQSVWLVGHQALRRVPRVAVVWDFLAERLETHRLLLAGGGARNHGRPSPVVPAR